MKLRMALALPAVLLISSCQTWGPTWSEVTGRMYNLPPPSFNDAPTAVQNIDGNGAFPDGPLMPIKITPGKHQLVLAAAPLSKWPGGTNLENFTLDAEPCMRYYINGRYETRLGLDWTPYIGYKELIAGCTVPGK